MGERNIWALRNQYIVTGQNGHTYVNMTSSKGVHIRHHVHMFLHRPLVLKIHQIACHMSGTKDKGKKKNMAKSEGDIF